MVYCPTKLEQLTSQPSPPLVSLSYFFELSPLSLSLSLSPPPSLPLPLCLPPSLSISSYFFSTPPPPPLTPKACLPIRTRASSHIFLLPTCHHALHHSHMTLTLSYSELHQVYIYILLYVLHYIIILLVTFMHSGTPL